MDVVQVLERDVIPSIDEPQFDSEYIGVDRDNVIVFETDAGRARAYPVRILNHHEIVNDVVEGTPIAVTWCPLCWSAVVYDRVLNGRRLSFGVSGKLADDSLVLYDRETGSEWKQSSGRAFRGPLEGRSLRILPSRVMEWQRFRDVYPDGRVLQPAADDADPDGRAAERRIDYEEEYSEYFESDRIGSRSTPDRTLEWSHSFDPKTLVLGIRTNGEAVGIPLTEVTESGGVVTTTIGESSIVIFATDGVLQGFENPGLSFEPTEQSGTFRGDGTVWDGTVGISDDGRVLEPIAAQWTFAFVWQDDHAPDAFY